MPFREMIGRKYWCPGWWPWQWFDTCTREVLGWCYKFDYYKEYKWVFATKVVACEGKNEYSFWKAAVGFGSDTSYEVNYCTDEELSKSGTCEVNIGVNRFGFTPSSEPFVSQLDFNVADLRSDVAEEGTFEFTHEHPVFCKTGRWPYKKMMHEQVITASVAIRGVTVQWYLAGIPITNNSGTLSISASCKWPFPLPNGRSANRVIQVKYDIVTEERKSTLRVFNDPMDGSYSLSIGMIALLGGKKYTDQYTSAMFHGETCDFEREQLEEFVRCLRRVLAKQIEKRFSWPPPTISGPQSVLTLPEEVWRFVPEERREAINYLHELLIYSLPDDPETFTQAINQLEQEIGLDGITRLIKIGSPGSQGIRTQVQDRAYL